VSGFRNFKTYHTGRVCAHLPMPMIDKFLGNSMSKIREFIFDQTRENLEWVYEGRRIQLAAKDFEQALVDTVYDLVFALKASNALPDRLHVFSALGKEIVTLDAPDGFQFYYLTPYSTLGVSVVCVTSEPIAGWNDWHFGFDLKTNKLFRYCRAY
jgi:hypothetical protein